MKPGNVRLILAVAAAAGVVAAGVIIEKTGFSGNLASFRLFNNRFAGRADLNDKKGIILLRSAIFEAFYVKRSFGDHPTIQRPIRRDSS